MAWTPSHKVYASNGTSLLYTIEDVMDRNPALALTIPDTVSYENLRSSGEITVSGGNKAYDMTLYARLASSSYTNLMTALEALKVAIPINTNLYLKIDKSDSTTEDIKVKRLSIEVDTTKGNLNKWLYYTITFRCLAWS